VATVWGKHGRQYAISVAETAALMGNNVMTVGPRNEAFRLVVFAGSTEHECCNIAPLFRWLAVTNYRGSIFEPFCLP
jgi:hypothetical protein